MEYVNTNFIEFCFTHGIQMQHTMIYTPQHNGVDEHKITHLKKYKTKWFNLKI
jgi:hypothetical protein